MRHKNWEKEKIVKEINTKKTREDKERRKVKKEIKNYLKKKFFN